MAELTSDKRSMHLDTDCFESDGISPTKRLTDNWESQISRALEQIDKKLRSRGGRGRTPPRPLIATAPSSREEASDPWALPPPKSSHESSDRGTKRGYSDDRHDGSSRGLLDIRQSSKEYERNGRDRRDYRDRESDRHRTRDFSPNPPSSKIPSLLDLNTPSTAATTATTSNENPLMKVMGAAAANQTPEQMAAAVQLLAATMQLSGGNQTNFQNVFSALMDKQQQEQREREKERLKLIERQIEEERRQSMQKQIEEQRKVEAQKRFEEAKRQEELKRAAEERKRKEDEDRRREALRREEKRKEELRQQEERRRREAEEKQRLEEQRLREIQLAAKLAMDKQREQEEMVRRAKQAALLQEQQAQLALMAVTRQVQEQFTKQQPPQPVPLMSINQPKPPTTALERLNDKFRSDKDRNEKLPGHLPETMPAVKRLAQEPVWLEPLILFSYVSRQNERKPLRGISGGRLHRSLSSKAVGDYRSRNQIVYKLNGEQAPVLSFLKIKVKRRGEMSEFEKKVSLFNNRLQSMMDESDELLKEARRKDYFLRSEFEDSRPSKSGNSALSRKDDGASVQKSQAASGKSNEKERPRETGGGDARNKLQTRRGSDSKKDLRDLLNKSTDSARASRNDSKGSSADTKRTREGSAPPSADTSKTKPRWDKSDESDDELLWDDDPDPVKVPLDDDDAKSTVSTNMATDSKDVKSEAVKQEPDTRDDQDLYGNPDAGDEFVTIDEAA